MLSCSHKVSAPSRTFILSCQIFMFIFFLRNRDLTTLFFFGFLIHMYILKFNWTIDRYSFDYK